MSAHSFTFREFELNLRAEVLQKSGARVRLASQPLKLLALLVRRSGELVTREEIQNELWTKDVVVDFDHLVNQYIRQLRSVLGDNRESPTFIETAPRRGYRFIAPVEVVATSGRPMGAPSPAPQDTALAAAVVGAPPVAAPAPPPARVRRMFPVPIVVGALAVVAIALFSLYFATQASQVPRSSRPLNPEAGAAYAKARHFYDLGTQDGYKKSCDYFQLALQADPSHALVYRGMADCYLALSSAALGTPEDMIPKARAMTLKAIELDDSLAEAHSTLGVIRLNYDWDWPGAFAELQKARQLEPENRNITYALSSYYRAVGQVDAAARELKHLESLDSADWKNYQRLGWLYVFAGRYAAAAEELRKCIELAPYDAISHLGLSHALTVLGQPQEAMAELQQFLTLYKEPQMLTQVNETYRTAGFAQARRQYFELMAASFVRKNYIAYQIAQIYAMLGEKERALDYLEKAYRERSNYMSHMKVDSLLDNVRGEPRFRRLLELMQLTDEQLASAAQLTVSVRR